MKNEVPMSDAYSALFYSSGYILFSHAEELPENSLSESGQKQDLHWDQYPGFDLGPHLLPFDFFAGEGRTELW